MSELVVEAGKFDKSSVEKDNSMERKRMMEVLLTDFDTTTANFRSTTELTNDDVSESEQADVDDEDTASDNENLNELISNNEADFELYTEIDNTMANTHLHLYTSPDDVPDWIKNPARPASASSSAYEPLGETRKRKAVAYDDGLTEKQFVRLMEKQVRAEEKEASQRKKKRAKTAASARAASKETEHMEDEEGEGEEVGPTGALTSWTFRKLISSVKIVIALKEPTTKRRLSEIFLEKPDASLFPDYYEIIDRPIAINDILRKCRGHLYADVQEFRDDWKQLFANAVKYNGGDSWVAQDAMALEKELERTMKKNGFSDTPAPAVKRKPLRIKLSLKKKKATDEDSAGDASATAEAKKKIASKKKAAKKS
jgi:hypothetical protein